MPATTNQPTTNQPATAVNHSVARSALRRLALTALGVLIGVSIMVPLDTLTAASVDARARPNNCSGWSSTTQPPRYIRVLRVKSGRVQRVPFRKYVTTVMGKEWPSYLPQSVVEAGAVVVKQYGWFHALGRGRLSRRGQCYDVKDSTADQLYRPHKARVTPDIRRAVSKTWNVRLLRKGHFFMTGYRTGSKGRRCGHDANGHKLYARSAVKCGYQGWSYSQILRRYYSHIRLIGG